LTRHEYPTKFLSYERQQRPLDSPSGAEIRVFTGEHHLNDSLKTWSLKNWLGQVTTGHGFMIIAATLFSALAGIMSWTIAAPLLVAGVIGLFWPENLALQSSAQVAVDDVEKIVAAYASAPSSTNVVIAVPAPHTSI
jgi:hypothetical protein